MVIQICVGSSCHLKGSPQIAQLLQDAVIEHHLETEVALVGSFCIGKCNPVGVTVQVDDELYTGITTMSFREFFKAHVLDVLQSEGLGISELFTPRNTQPRQLTSRAS